MSPNEIDRLVFEATEQAFLDSLSLGLPVSGNKSVLWDRVKDSILSNSNNNNNINNNNNNSRNVRIKLETNDDEEEF
jgi:hypothetical protein